jgi:phosphate transport system substrate-binding protein
VNQLRAITVAGLLAATVLPAVAVEISGAGATFPYPLYAKWADTYRKETGIGLNYQSIGSGGGIKQIEAKTVTFGATDAPLKGPELDKFGLVQFPMVMAASCRLSILTASGRASLFSTARRWPPSFSGR